MFLPEQNNTIYMGDDMIDSLANTIQCEDNDARIDLQPKVYDPNNNNSQSITFPYGTSIPGDYYRMLTYIAVRKPAQYEVENCEQISLPSKFHWDPYVKGGILSKVESHSNDIDSVMESYEGKYPILAEIS